MKECRKQRTNVRKQVRMIEREGEGCREAQRRREKRIAVDGGIILV
jgi:hypothetical protein